MEIKIPRSFWTEETIASAMAECSEKSEFNKKYSSAALVARAHDWYEELWIQTRKT